MATLPEKSKGSVVRSLAMGALAIGVTAVGAVAIGALAIGRLSVRKGRIGKLTIGELTIDRIVLRNLSPQGVSLDVWVAEPIGQFVLSTATRTSTPAAPMPMQRLTSPGVLTHED